jgi:hypothetical protein
MDDRPLSKFIEDIHIRQKEENRILNLRNTIKFKKLLKEKRAIELAKAFGNKDIESLQTNLQNFKQDIEKKNNGQMDYSTMRTLYG